MSVQYFEGIGRRKESTARVRLMTGTGKFTVNEKPVEEYFPRTGDMRSNPWTTVCSSAGPRYI